MARPMPKPGSVGSPGNPTSSPKKPVGDVAWYEAEHEARRKAYNNRNASLPVQPGVAARTAATKAMGGITDEGKGRQDIDWVPDETHGSTRKPAVHRDTVLLDIIHAALTAHRQAQSVRNK